MSRKHNERCLRLPAVCEKTGFSKPSIYRLMSEGRFPQSKRIGARAVAWLESELDDWIDNLKSVR